MPTATLFSAILLNLQLTNMSAKVQVDSTLEKLFQGFLETTQKEMKSYYDSQDESNLQSLQEMQTEMGKIINSNEEKIKSLLENLSKMRNHKDLRTSKLYLSYTRSQHKHKLLQSLNAWIAFHKKLSEKRKKNVFVANFYKRGIIQRNYKAWKNETQKVHKEHVNQATMKRIMSEVAVARIKANEEAELLKLMVKELTEDLRNETIAKNTLRYKFEQSLLRGMSALNMENMGIRQDIISQTRSFTETSRALLYTPDKFGYLTNS